MPDESLADGHLEVAYALAASESPTQSEIRRAISTCYYAVYHALAATCANCLVGDSPEDRPENAWVEIYRGLNHRVCKNSCANAHSVNFPASIKLFADAFVQLQELRLKADYDPKVKFQKGDANTHIATAKLSIDSLNSTDVYHKRAFAAWVLISSQGAKKARSA